MVSVPTPPAPPVADQTVHEMLFTSMPASAHPMSISVGSIPEPVAPGPHGRVLGTGAGVVVGGVAATSGVVAGGAVVGGAVVGGTVVGGTVVGGGVVGGAVVDGGVVGRDVVGRDVVGRDVGIGVLAAAGSSGALRGEPDRDKP